MNSAMRFCRGKKVPSGVMLFSCTLPKNNMFAFENQWDWKMRFLFGWPLF